MMSSPLFTNREEAGRALATQCQEYAELDDVIVLGLPRGGVPIAYEIAKQIACPLDIILVRKLGTPLNKELAMGAIASGGVIVFNQDVINFERITLEQIEAVKARESAELKRRELHYRGDRPFPDLKNKTVILCDDGIATGATFRAAIEALKQHQPAHIIAAVPVCAPDTAYDIEARVDKLITLATPTPFYGIGMWYVDFPQCSDEEVIAALHLLRRHPGR